jgi:hypothetical protein
MGKQVQHLRFHLPTGSVAEPVDFCTALAQAPAQKYRLWLQKKLPVHRFRLRNTAFAYFHCSEIKCPRSKENERISNQDLQNKL